MRNARVIYLIASHTNPEQVTRLVNACRSGNSESRVLLHHNQACSHLDMTPFRAMPDVDILPVNFDTKWGGFAACAMMIYAMRWLLENRSFDWVIYLSGQDYPIRPLSQIEDDLAAAEVDGFIEGKPVSQCRWNVGYLRYHYHFYNVPRFPRWQRLKNRLRERAKADVNAGNVLPRFVIPSDRHGEFKLGVKPLRSIFHSDFQCCFGSAWWTLNHRAIQAMLRTYDANPAIERHYKRVLFAATESLFQTLAINDRTLKLCTDNARRFVSWSRPETARPDVLRMSDWERIMASDAHFARKIDADVDPELLDQLDRVIGVPSTTDKVATLR